MDYAKEALKLHKEKKGKISVSSKVRLESRDDLSIAYTPGVAQPCLEIARNPDDIYTYTSKSNMVAVVTDGSAVLGLGNIGAAASIPVMEGKCVLFREFGGVDAFPIAIASQDVDDIVKTVKLISPVFGGINLEDISAPRCFEVEERLKKELDIPVFHDDQHGTAVVVLAGLTNALKLSGRNIADTSILINGSGAAGIAIANLLFRAGAREIVMLDTKGAIYQGRASLNPAKEEIAKITNRSMQKGGLTEMIKGRDVFIGVSKGNLLTKKDIQCMNRSPVVFAMANPAPEIDPAVAKDAGAFVVATGRSDYPNQVNNVLAFPGIFRGALDVRASDINDEMKLAAAHALAACVKNPSPDRIIPSPFEKGLAGIIAAAVKSLRLKLVSRESVIRVFPLPHQSQT